METWLNFRLGSRRAADASPSALNRGFVDRGDLHHQPVGVPGLDEGGVERLFIENTRGPVRGAVGVDHGVTHAGIGDVFLKAVLQVDHPIRGGIELCRQGPGNVCGERATAAGCPPLRLPGLARRPPETNKFGYFPILEKTHIMTGKLAFL